MKTLLKSLVTGTFAATVLAGVSMGDASAETTIRVNNWLPPTHPIVSDMIKPWAAAVEEATKGNVQVEILPAPLGPPPASFDIAKDGLADVAFGVHGYTPGRFTVTQIAELPFITKSSEALSAAYWRLHEKSLSKLNEHEGVKVLTVFTHGPGHIFTADEPVTSLDTLSGKKMRVGGGIVNDVATAMGMVPVHAPSSKSYELLSNGVADGILFPLESVPFFKLDSVLKHGMTVPGGLYNTSFFVVMNQNTWDSLSEADKKAIDSVSGEAFARMAGAAWDAADARGMEQIKAAGISMTEMPPEMLAEVKERVQPVIDKALEAISAKGIDAEAALAELQAATQ